MKRGELQPGRPLPSYAKLMQKYDLPRETGGKGASVLVTETACGSCPAVAGS